MSEDSSEDSPPRPKRKTKNILVFSGSSSDSDESVSRPRTRKRRLRVVSDGETSNSSGSSVGATALRRRRNPPLLRDSDWASDTSESASERSEAAAPPPSSAAAAIAALGFASDSSEGNSDKCSICLMRFTDQPVGIPENCDHAFCLDCITEWSRNVNTCPVDRSCFCAIVVHSRLGGRVLRSEPVHSRSDLSLDHIVIEDSTACMICGSFNDEDSMLLCDSCDLGFHMRCLTPPLLQIPLGQWYCPTCAENHPDDLIEVAEIRDLVDDDVDPNGVRGDRRSRSESGSRPNVPTTSGGRRRQESAGRTTTVPHNGARAWGVAPAPRRRAKRRRKMRTVIIEYQDTENGKFPLKKKRVAVKRRLRKSLMRKGTRTAARRSHVRASVRAQLAAQLGRQESHDASAPASALAVQRLRAGIPALRLFAGANDLDYWSEDEQHATGSAGSTLAVAGRHAPATPHVDAYAQARRKMLAVPSPPRASPAPDILSSILESQQLLHSKNSVVSVTVDGQLEIKAPKRTEGRSGRDAVDLSKGEEAARKVPSYPGQSRGGGGGGGWGGGYRGQRQRDQGGGFGRASGGYDSGYGGGYRGRQAPFQHGGGAWRDDSDPQTTYQRRSNQYSDCESPFARGNFNRRQLPAMNRSLGSVPPRYSNDGRPGPGSSWLPYPNDPAMGRREEPRAQARRFGGFDDALDMRMGPHAPTEAPRGGADDLYGDVDCPSGEEVTAQPPPYEPLPEPPVFTFHEKSEDEKSDSGLVIDTEKYDPTEPTHDDSSGDEGRPAAAAQPPPEAPGHYEGAEGLPPTVLDKAVQQVLQEHSGWMVASHPAHRGQASDDDSEGDCPNFSIYSATSVHIANNSTSLISEEVLGQQEESHYPPDEDLVQQDDDTPTRDESPDVHLRRESPEAPAPAPAPCQEPAADVDVIERVSKRCPITPNPRNPIKIKLNTPSLIKRQMVDLYDEDDMVETGEIVQLAESNSSDKNPSKIADSSDEKAEKDLSEKSRASPSPHPRVEDERASDSTPERNIPDSPSNRVQIEQPGTPESDDDLDRGDVASRADGEGSDKEPDTDSSSAKREEPDDDAAEKMTEPISEAEDERSYTPCLDENKAKEGLEGLEGLDTEMISEEEGNEIFSDNDKHASDKSSAHEGPSSGKGTPTPTATPTLGAREAEEEGEIMDKGKELAADKGEVKAPPDDRRRKRKESKKEAKDKAKSKSKKNDIAFKKLSKSGKERNYRDKDKNKEKEDKSKNKKERQKSAERERLRRKEKRKDLERYDVRTLVTDKRRKVKDPFGRDVSPRARSGSLSPAPQRSPFERSASRGRRSRSRSRSPALRRSASSSGGRRPLARRSLSHKQASASPKSSPLSPRGRRSTSRRRRKSISPRMRRSPSPLRGRKAKRSLSPRRLSPPPLRRKRSGSLRRKRARRSPSRSPKPKPRKKKRSRSERRSASPKDKKIRRARRKSRTPRNKSLKQKKTRARSISPELELSPERIGGRECAGPLWRDKSPLYRGWSRSLSRSVNSRLLSPGWTPPRDISPEPRHLRVILANDDVARKKEKKKRQRDADRARYAKHGKEGAGPSKEVFTSGNNILVSVSFNKNDQGDAATRGGDAPPKHKKRKNDARKERKEKRRRKAAAAADALNAKPVAIIDLDKSPFRELTPSPKNVIVLSDSDHGDKEDSVQRQPPAAEAAAAPPADHAAPARELPFLAAVGPKTPPEPSSIKFSIAAKPAAPLRPANPLREAEPPHEEGAAHKGPNTPPEPPNSPLSSQDAYDPFEPTKSRSASPAPPEPALEPTTITLETAQKTNLSADDVVNQRPISPMEKVMALLHSTRDVSPTNIDELSRERPPDAQEVATPAPAVAAPLASAMSGGVPAASVAPTSQSPEGSSGGPAYAPPAPAYLSGGGAMSRGSVFGGAPSPQRIVLPSVGRQSPLKAQQPKLFLAKPSPIKSNPIKPLQSSKISKLPMPSVRAVPARRAAGRGLSAAEVIELDAAFDSPYSPGSSDFGDLFEPPSSKGAKGDLFDSLFGSKPLGRTRSRSNATKVPVRQIKKKGNKTQVGVKIDEDNLKILDELPSSAVEMQVKSKFLKKLNRQERVVEEVKLVLKPHYYRKRVTKDEYKEILRRTVPKICHNKSGEINPSKIQTLVEAYVRKFRKRHKLGLA